MISAQSTPNIAFIKYWGNRNNDWRLPAADSLSMTLDSPAVEVTAEPSEEFSVQSFNPDGSEKALDEKAVERFRTHWELVNEYKAGIPLCALTIRSQIPPGVGLASSAAVFSAVAKAYAGLVGDLNDEQVSILARLGSGSASRSVFSGFVALENHDDSIAGATARQIAPAEHWPLHDIVIVPDQTHKKVGSTQGHALAQTSPHWNDRFAALPKRQEECISAIEQKDFAKLQAVSEEDCLDMHHVMETSTPPLQYLSDETHRIIDEVKALREAEHLEVLFTMDAGPTVHLVCTDNAKTAIAEFAAAQKGCQVFATKIAS